jgi:hypothetical protein
MDYKILNEIIINDVEHLLDGYRLTISIVATDYGRMLKITIDYGGDNKISFFTDSKWFIIERRIFANELDKIKKDLCKRYGDNCDLSNNHKHGLFKDYALFDVEKIWNDFGYLPTRKFNLFEFWKDIKANSFAN